MRFTSQGRGSISPRKKRECLSPQCRRIEKRGPPPEAVGAVADDVGFAARYDGAGGGGSKPTDGILWSAMLGEQWPLLSNSVIVYRRRARTAILTKQVLPFPEMHLKFFVVL